MSILTAAEAALVLKIPADDSLMLSLLPGVDVYIKDATGRDWAGDDTIREEAKNAARILIALWYDNPAMVSLSSVISLPWGLRACLVQLEALAAELESSGVPDEALEIVSSMPADGDIDIALVATMTVIFNHDMASGVTSAIALTESGASVAGSAALDATSRILTFTPDSSLSASTTYVIEIDAAPDSYGYTVSKDITFKTV